MDLTKIDQPLGTLDMETKLALCRASFEGKAIEIKSRVDGKWTVTNPPLFLLRGVYRLQPEPLRDISLPWAALDDRWQWAARDKSGESFISDTAPHRYDTSWGVRGRFLLVADLFSNFDPGNKPWSESLIRRPEGV